MAEGRRQADWQPFAWLMALMANLNQSPRQRAFGPDDFNPYAEGRQIEVTPADAARIDAEMRKRKEDGEISGK